MTNWIKTLAAVLDAGQSACVVTLANTRGSAPREAGARMVVTLTNTTGTIGGGQLEYQCIKLAVRQMQDGTNDRATRLRTFPLGSNCGQCCGGVVDVLFQFVSAENVRWPAMLSEMRQDCVVMTAADGATVVISEDEVVSFGTSENRLSDAAITAREMLQNREPVRWVHKRDGYFLYQRVAQTDFDIAVFGAGHVGSATVAALAVLDCRIRWIDGRSNVFPSSVPGNVTTSVTAHKDAVGSYDVIQEVAAMPPGSYFLIMTHSHALDFHICDEVLRRRDSNYCGLIGSLSKRRRFEGLMRKQGMPVELLSDLVCPIGIGGIPGKRPTEIAIAVAAQLLQVRAAASKPAELSAPANVRAI